MENVGGVKRGSGRLEDWFDFDIDVINYAVNISGGADSAILTFFLCDYLEKNNIEKTIYSITTANRSDPLCTYFANSVIELIKESYPKQNFVYKFDYTTDGGGSKHDVANKIKRELKNKNLANVFLEGVTRNPKENGIEEKYFQGVSQGVSRMDHRDQNEWSVKYENGCVVSRPFYNFDKKEIVKLFKEKFGGKIAFKLKEKSRSCTSTLMFECNDCWWCKEKSWAFEQVS